MAKITLQGLLDRYEEERMTKSEFLEAVQMMVGKLDERMGRDKGELNAAVVRIAEEFTKLRAEIAAEMGTAKEGLSEAEKSALARMEKKLSDLQASVDAKLLEVRNGEDADEEMILEKLKMHSGEMHKEMMVEMEKKLPQFGTAFRDGLELLQGNERLEIAAIKDLREELDELKRMRTTKLGGGGTSAIGVASALNFALKKETPSGAINSSNTTYTVTKPINAVIAFAINGQAITDDEYTVAGKTITMDSAIDSSLSGTSFRITYV